MFGTRMWVVLFLPFLKKLTDFFLYVLEVFQECKKNFLTQKKFILK